jgi:hypothetical protein
MKISIEYIYSVLPIYFLLNFDIMEKIVFIATGGKFYVKIKNCNYW